MNRFIEHVYRGFYRLCRVLGTVVIAAARAAAWAASYVVGACRYASSAVVELFSSLLERVMSGRGKDRAGVSLARGVSAAATAVGRSLSETSRICREKGMASGLRSIADGAKSFFFSAAKKAAPAFNVVLTIGAVAACAIVIADGNDFSYGISVTFKGESIGVVKDETVFNRAVSSICEKVENATGESYRVDVDPDFEVVVVTDMETFASEADIEEQIIANSPELFREGTGLYINGELIAVTDYGDGVENVLQTILTDAKENYSAVLEEAGADNIEAQFTDSVELKDGLYPITAKMTFAQIKQLLTSVVSEEQLYTIQSGDSPKSIAAKFELKLSELYELNPGMEDSVIYAGDVIVIGNEVPYLQVQMTCTLSYEEETEIPVNYIETSAYYEGVTKVKKEGAAGIDRVTAQVTYVNGTETERVIISTETVKEPVTQDVYKGTKKGNTLPTLSGSYIRPVEGGRISSPYGYRTHPVTGEKQSFHTGLDIAVAKNTPIHAAASGTIIFMGSSGNYGNLVKIDHGGGYVTYYAHCNSFASGLKVGDKVEVGDTVAYVGMTGRATGYHVHFEIRYKNQAMNINGLFS